MREYKMTLGNEPKIIVPCPLARGVSCGFSALIPDLCLSFLVAALAFLRFYVVGCLHPCRSPLRALIRTFCRHCYPKY